MGSGAPGAARRRQRGHPHLVGVQQHRLRQVDGRLRRRPWARRTGRGSAPPPRSSARCARPRRPRHRPLRAPAPPAPRPPPGATAAACPPPCGSWCPPPRRSRPPPRPACPPAAPHPARPPACTASRRAGPRSSASGVHPGPVGQAAVLHRPRGGAEVLRVARAHQHQPHGEARGPWASVLPRRGPNGRASDGSRAPARRGSQRPQERHQVGLLLPGQLQPQARG